MRKVVLPFEPHQEQPAAQTSSLPFVTLNQEGTIGERAQLAQESTELEKTITLVTHLEATVVAFELEILPPTTPMPIQTSIIASQDIAATLTTAKTLLLLTLGPQFDRTTTPACSEQAKSSASHSHHIAKLPSKAPSHTDAFPKPSEI